MLEAVRTRVRAALRRVERLERRELRELHRWLEDTRHLLLLSVLVAVPLLMGVLTYLSNVLDLLPFLLFPPLASGAYTLFAQPGSRYASPKRFVGGLTIGAASGWVALELTARYWYHVSPEGFSVHPGAAAFGLLLTGVVTWALDLEESQSFSTALLVLVTGADQFIYVVSVFVSSVIVAGVFTVWREEVYHRRAEFLYGTVQTDDHILVPVRGDGPAVERVAAFAGQLAGAHDAGKVVLLDVVRADRPPEATDDASAPPAVREASTRLAGLAEGLERRFEVPIDTVVAGGDEDDARTALEVASETGCDLIAVAFETADEADRVSPFLRTLFQSTHDVVALRPAENGGEWRHALVPIRRDGEVAHAMVDFAQRLVGPEGSVTVCHCIKHERQRRDAEAMLADIVDQFDRALETRVATMTIQTFLDRHCEPYDVTFIGASTDRSAASRVISPPTFRRLRDLDGDFAVVHRG